MASLINRGTTTLQAVVNRVDSIQAVINRVDAKQALNSVDSSQAVNGSIETNSSQITNLTANGDCLDTSQTVNYVDANIQNVNHIANRVDTNPRSNVDICWFDDLRKIHRRALRNAFKAI